MALPQQKLSLDDFLVWEEAQIERHEFYRGDVFAMAGGSRAHAEVCGNVYSALRNHVKDTPCRAYTESATLQVRDDMIFFPDAFVTCDAQDKQTKRIFRNPVLVVEVLSDSTQAYDRSLKFAAYRQVASLREYLLIDPETKTVEVFRRNERNIFELHDQTSADELVLTSIDLHMPMADVFDGVETAAG
jgi:Uma2 family endonuclease